MSHFSTLCCHNKTFTQPHVPRPNRNDTYLEYTTPPHNFTKRNNTTPLRHDTSHYFTLLNQGVMLGHNSAPQQDISTLHCTALYRNIASLDRTALHHNVASPDRTARHRNRASPDSTTPIPQNTNLHMAVTELPLTFTLKSITQHIRHE